MKSKRLDGLGNRCGVKLVIPPEYAVDLAGGRTNGMLSYFLEVVRGRDFLAFYRLLPALVNSAYLQGVSDTAEMLVKKGVKF